MRWPSKLLDQMCGKENHHGIPHPKSEHKGMLEEKSIAGWAGRFHSWILSQR
ncbi:MAG: Tn7-like element transposition protein TnsE [Burkholderiaceae bacterium]